MQGLVNKDMCDVLGNLINRSMQFSVKKFGETVPQAGAWTALETAALAKTKALLEDFKTHMAQCEYRKSMSALRAIWVEGNQYITEAAPWTQIKTDPDRAAAILNFTMNYIRMIAIISFPVIPESSKMIASFLNVEIDAHAWLSDIEEEMTALEEGHPLKKPEILFRKIEDDIIATCEERFKAPVSKAA